MKFGIVVFPGSNCDRDMMHVLKDVLHAPTEFIWHKNSDLGGLGKDDCVVLPGGFSYGDYLRTGAIARFSPVMDEVIAHAKRGGKVLGVCNGFQILCESGLLPGVLLKNLNEQFICKNVHLRVENNKTQFTNGADLGQVLKIPIAHADGRYQVNEQGLDELRANEQILFRYCSNEGETADAFNPNGSLDNIAGIANKNFNVFGMMPHPERASEDELGNADGHILMASLLQSMQMA